MASAWLGWLTGSLATALFIVTWSLGRPEPTASEEGDGAARTGMAGAPSTSASRKPEKYCVQARKLGSEAVVLTYAMDVPPQPVTQQMFWEESVQNQAFVAFFLTSLRTHCPRIADTILFWDTYCELNSCILLDSRQEQLCTIVSF